MSSTGYRETKIDQYRLQRFRDNVVHIVIEHHVNLQIKDCDDLQWIDTNVAYGAWAWIESYVGE